MTTGNEITARWYRNQYRWYRKIARRIAAVGGTADVTLTGATRVDERRVTLSAGDAEWMIHHGLVEMDPTSPSIVHVRETELERTDEQPPNNRRNAPC